MKKSENFKEKMETRRVCHQNLLAVNYNYCDCSDLKNFLRADSFNVNEITEKRGQTWSSLEKKFDWTMKFNLNVEKLALQIIEHFKFISLLI